MNRTQKYISLLLERLPKYELRSYEHQTNLDQIRDRISTTSDINAELLSLYKVKNCAEFALSLMWIADKVQKDLTKEESTIDEETFVFTKFRQAMGDVSPSGQEPATEGTISEISGSHGFGSTPAPEPTSAFDSSSQRGIESSPTPGPEIDAIFGAMAQPSDFSQPRSASPVSRGEQELGFATLLEQFLESVQSGSDDRTKLLSNVIDECNAVLASGSAAEDYKQFCRMLTEFLTYISNNQYMDDVRVMNILSNIQDPFAQWARSMPEDRSGLLDPINDILRDFKTMFE